MFCSLELIVWNSVEDREASWEDKQRALVLLKQFKEDEDKKQLQREGLRKFAEDDSELLREAEYDFSDEVLSDISKHSLLDVNENVVPSFYKKCLSSTLLKAVERNLDTPISEQVSLFQELAIIREIGCKPVNIYDKICAQLEVIENEINTNDKLDEDGLKILKDLFAKLNEQKDIAADNVIKHFKVVSEFVEKAARIDALSREKFSIHVIHSLIAQFTRVSADILNSNGLNHIAVQFEEEINRRLIVPVNSNVIDVNNEMLGTKLTPDLINDCVKAMDALVPHEMNGNNGKE